MDVTGTKVLIIFGLLLSTFFASILPWIFVQYSLRKRRRQRRNKNASDGDLPLRKQLFWCCINELDKNETSIVANGSVKSTASAKQRKSRAKRAISGLNCFAGGIFLGTSFIGLLPEIGESFDSLQISWPKLASSSATPGNGTESSEEELALMPLAEIVIVCGLFFILSVEQAAHAWNHNRQRRKQRSVVVDNANIEMVDSPLSKNSDQEYSPLPSKREGESEEHDHSSIRSLILVASLSIHSCLEGIAMGLQDKAGSVIAIFIAVLLHKSLMAFSMGTNLVKSKQAAKRVFAAAAIFSFMSPIGIAVGLIIKVTGGNDSGTVLVNAVLQAIATGTFLYITFFEVLVREFESHGDRLLKVLCLLAGYGSILCTFFAQHA